MREGQLKMMTVEEMYEFDLNGYIVYRNVLSQNEVDKINTIIDNAGVGGTGKAGQRKFKFFHLDLYFMELMAHPRTLAILEIMLGKWLRFDHAFGLEMIEKSDKIPKPLHAGPLKEQLAFFYQWSNNKMRNGLVKVIYALNDVNPGDGGFICVPGSHKANIEYRPKQDSHLVVNPSLKAGDMLIFTEALIHGSRPWKSSNLRRVLIYSYAPGCLAWMNYKWCEPYRKLATNDIQKQLLRPPHVGAYSEQLELDFQKGRFPNIPARPPVNFPKDEYVYTTQLRQTFNKTKDSAQQFINGLRELKKLLFS